MITHSSILARKMPWMEEPGRLQSMGSQRFRHNLVTKHAHMSRRGVWGLQSPEIRLPRQVHSWEPWALRTQERSLRQRKTSDPKDLPSQVGSPGSGEGAVGEQESRCPHRLFIDR